MGREKATTHTYIYFLHFLSLYVHTHVQTSYINATVCESIHKPMIKRKSNNNEGGEFLNFQPTIFIVDPFFVFLFVFVERKYLCHRFKHPHTYRQECHKFLHNNFLIFIIIFYRQTGHSHLINCACFFQRFRSISF